MGKHTIDNSKRLNSMCEENDCIISGTFLQIKPLLDGNTKRQIDHIMINSINKDTLYRTCEQCAMQALVVTTTLS